MQPVIQTTQKNVEKSLIIRLRRLQCDTRPFSKVIFRQFHWAVFLGELSKRSFSVHNTRPAQSSRPTYLKMLSEEMMTHWQERFPLLANVALRCSCAKGVPSVRVFSRPIAGNIVTLGRFI
uniref:Uncharacterized protein n=1 Tax=Oncorhynchus mykiss TaxID=8022 RepID=A0A8K9UDR1_ONCMY